MLISVLAYVQVLAWNLSFHINEYADIQSYDILASGLCKVWQYFIVSVLP